MKYLKVKDKNNLMRDNESNAIINTDLKGYKDYENNYKRLYIQNQRINEVEKNVNEIKNDLNEIKTLLRNLANGS
jgi:flagellar basal body rod protein FlgG